MSSETAISLVVFLASILWCHAAVLAWEWLGTLRRASQNDKVGHVVSLLGAFVPVVVTYITVVLVGAVIGLPSMVVFLAPTNCPRSGPRQRALRSAKEVIL